MIAVHVKTWGGVEGGMSMLTDTTVVFGNTVLLRLCDLNHDNVHSTLHTVYYKLYRVYCALHCTLYTEYCKLYSVYTVHYSVQYTLHT